MTAGTYAVTCAFMGGLLTFDERLQAICAGMAARDLDAIVALHDGAHFIETPNPVTVLSGFKSLGPAACLVDRAGGVTLIVAPAWDAERARALCPGVRVIDADDVVEGLHAAMPSGKAVIGTAGLAAAPDGIARRVAALCVGAAAADDVIFDAAARKTDEEIGWAREATRIAERNYERLLAVARPGMSEDELAVELRMHSKSLGAEDNFLLLCASPHNRAVAPSNGRRIANGHIILAEITPSYRGQLAQICRTIVVGEAPAQLREKYALVVTAMNAGIDAARTGARMADVCRAINAVLEAQGYGEYCHPPHIRRRGHGLGFASMRPGDVALDNDTVLEPGMLFMIHPNQYLPETGYLLCGEPVLMGATRAEPLTRRQAALAELR
jgi:Xaa-Pro dipeptidase